MSDKKPIERRPQGNDTLAPHPQRQPVLVRDGRGEVVAGLRIEHVTHREGAVTIEGWSFGGGTFELLVEETKLRAHLLWNERPDVAGVHGLGATNTRCGFSLRAPVRRGAASTNLRWTTRVDGGPSTMTFPIQFEHARELSGATLRTLKCAANVERIDKDALVGWVAYDGFVGRQVRVELLVDNAVVVSTFASVQREDVIRRLGATAAFAIRAPLERIDGALLARIASAGDARPSVQIRLGQTSHLLALDESEIEAFVAAATTASARHTIVSRGETELLDRAMRRVAGEPRAGEGPTTTAIAFYLPQFHRTPENDQWWGPGFTEWTNVTQARPAFAGHHQPHVPADLGFYDASDPSTLLAQIALARKYGVGAFCFHYYWFNGKRVLTKPVDAFVQLESDFPFMLCWANENWTRRWDGLETDVLLPQEHRFEKDVEFIRDVLPYLQDPRYLTRSDGSKWLVVYRPSLMPMPVELFTAWREIAQEHGVRLHISCIDGFDQAKRVDLGCDSMIQFPPNGFAGRSIAESVPRNPGFEGVALYPYADVATERVAAYANSVAGGSRVALVPGVTPCWDNSARKKGNASILHGSTPSAFYAWTKAVCALQNRHMPVGERYLFVNAWNEWAEGAHLEPDTLHGCRYLAALNHALLAADSGPSTSLPSGESNADVVLGESMTSRIESRGTLEPELGERLLQDLLRSGAVSGAFGVFDISHFTSTVPSIIARVASAKRSLREQLRWNVEQLNGRGNSEGTSYVFRQHGLNLSGWLALPTAFQQRHPVFFCLQAENGRQFWSISSRTHARKDVENALTNADVTMHGLGFQLNAVLGPEIESGPYVIDAYVVVSDEGDRHASLLDIRLTGLEIL